MGPVSAAHHPLFRPHSPRTTSTLSKAVFALRWKAQCKPGTLEIRKRFADRAHHQPLWRLIVCAASNHQSQIFRPVGLLHATSNRRSTWTRLLQSNCTRNVREDTRCNRNSTKARHGPRPRRPIRPRAEVLPCAGTNRGRPTPVPIYRACGLSLTASSRGSPEADPQLR